jgi:hypothetical protein
MSSYRVEPCGQSPLAQELTAQIQVGLFGTVGQLARQLRAVDRVAPQLRAAGLVRPLAIDRNVRRRAAGFAAVHRSIHAFGGLLYAVGVLKHELTVEASTIVSAGQDSRVNVGDMTYLESDRRLSWKKYNLMYDLLQSTFDDPAGLPDLMILDVPLIFGREIYAIGLDDDELKDEAERLRERAEAFWAANRPRCFPFDPKGPKVVTLRTREPGELLLRLHDPAKGRGCSPDPLSGEVEELLDRHWQDILSARSGKVIQGILTPQTRTAAYASAESVDPRTFPRSLISGGMIAFHYHAGIRGKPILVETLGSQDCWTPEALDELAGNLIALTYFDNSKALPLPLWYAHESAATVRSSQWLIVYKRMVQQALREEHVDNTWLSGWGDTE